MSPSSLEIFLFPINWVYRFWVSFKIINNFIIYGFLDHYCLRELSSECVSVSMYNGETVVSLWIHGRVSSMDHPLMVPLEAGGLLTDVRGQVHHAGLPVVLPVLQAPHSKSARCFTNVYSVNDTVRVNSFILLALPASGADCLIDYILHSALVITEKSCCL